MNNRKNNRYKKRKKNNSNTAGTQNRYLVPIASSYCGFSRLSYVKASVRTTESIR